MVWRSFVAVLTGSFVIRPALGSPSGHYSTSRHKKMRGRHWSVWSASHWMSVAFQIIQSMFEQLATFPSDSRTLDVPSMWCNLKIYPPACICYQQACNLPINQVVDAFMALAKWFSPHELRIGWHSAAKVTFGESFFYDRIILPIHVRYKKKRRDSITTSQEDGQNYNLVFTFDIFRLGPDSHVCKWKPEVFNKK